VERGDQGALVALLAVAARENPSTFGKLLCVCRTVRPWRISALFE
jgi:hypothetical protein